MSTHYIQKNSADAMLFELYLWETDEQYDNKL